MIVIEKELAVDLVRAGLGENFNSAKTHAVILRGKWVLVDADFTDGRFGRKLAAGEAIDIDLPAVRSSGRAGQRLQIGKQFIGIVGQGFELFTRDDDRSGVVRRVHIQRRCAIGDLNLLLFDLDCHGNVKTKRLVRGDEHAVVFIESESLGNDI